MLFGPKLRYLNELEINGETVDDDTEDFTNEQPDPDEDETEDTEATDDVDDELDDFTEDEFDAGEETEGTDEPVDEEPIAADEEELDDFTEDEFDAGEDDTTTGEETEPAEDNAEEGGDDLADFTEDEFNAGDDAEDTGIDDANNEPAEGEATEGDAEEVGNNNEGDGNTLADMEKNLFADLSPQQLAIKNNELLHNYIELYETINTIFDSINKIPKTFDNNRPLTFITDQLVELKDMVNYIITTTYVTRTYVENMTYYKQALVILEQLNSMLKALIQKPAK